MAREFKKASCFLLYTLICHISPLNKAEQYFSLSTLSVWASFRKQTNVKNLFVWTFQNHTMLRFNFSFYHLCNQSDFLWAANHYRIPWQPPGQYKTQFNCCNIKLTYNMAKFWNELWEPLCNHFIKYIMRHLVNYSRGYPMLCSPRSTKLAQ